MRNIWYPKKMAGYVTEAQQQILGDKNTAERDPTFGTRKERDAIKKVKVKAPNLVKERTTAQVRAPPRPVPVEAPIEPRPVQIEVLAVSLIVSSAN
jgi:hypothetical protein